MCYNNLFGDETMLIGAIVLAVVALGFDTWRELKRNKETNRFVVSQIAKEFEK